MTIAAVALIGLWFSLRVVGVEIQAFRAALDDMGV